MVRATIPGRIDDGIEKLLDAVEEQVRIIGIWEREYAAIEAERDELRARIDKALKAIRGINNDALMPMPGGIPIEQLWAEVNESVLNDIERMLEGKDEANSAQ